MIQLSTHAIIGASKKYPPLNDNIIFACNADNSAIDEIGSNDGTLVNGTTYATGRIGQAFSFDGVNDYITFADNSWSFTSDFSVSCWVNINSKVAEQCVISAFTYVFPQSRGWDLSILLTSGAVRFRTNSSGALRTNLISTTELSINTWYHIVITRLAGTRSRLYINGVLESSDTEVNNPNYWPTPSDNNCTIGASTRTGVGTYTEYMNGLIDTPDIWDIELDQTKITKLYNNGNGRQYPF
jgi:hypothetical protein